MLKPQTSTAGQEREASHSNPCHPFISRRGLLRFLARDAPPWRPTCTSSLAAIVERASKRAEDITIFPGCDRALVNYHNAVHTGTTEGNRHKSQETFTALTKEEFPFGLGKIPSILSEASKQRSFQVFLRPTNGLTN